MILGRSMPSRGAGPRTSAEHAEHAERTERTERTERRSPAHRFAPLVIHIPAVAAAALAYWLSDDPVVVLFVGGVCVIPTYLLLAWIEGRRAPLYVSPLSFYFVWYAGSLGFSALHMANRIDNRELIKFSVTYLHPKDIAAAYVIFLFASLALHAGLQILRPLPEGGHRPDASEVEEKVPVFGFALLWIAGMTVRLLGSSVSFLGAAVGVLYWAPMTALCAYTLARGSARSLGLRFWALLLTGVMLEFVFSVRGGSKAYIMYSFLPPVWLFLIRRSYRKWLIPTALALGLFYIGLVAPVVMASRQLHWSTSGDPAGRIIQTYVDKTYESEALDHQSHEFLDRMFEPAPLAFLYREVERSGLRYGETLDYMTYAFIPRPFWPEKPSVSRGAWFTLYLGQARNEREVSTSTGLTAPGELYWNFGFGGVIAGMALIGLLVGGLWRLAGTKPHKDGLLLLLYLTLCFGMADMAEAGSVIVGIIYRALVIGMLVWITRYAAALTVERSVKRRVGLG